MTNIQTLFNKAVTAVIEQGEPSLNTDGYCVYRGPNNHKCAVGHLISDEHYNPEMENKILYDRFVKKDCCEEPPQHDFYRSRLGNS